eukprot:474672_1
MTVTINAVSLSRHLWYKAAAIGGIVGFVFCICLLFHVIYHCCKLVKSKSYMMVKSGNLSASLLNKNKCQTCKNKSTDPKHYYLVICYLITSMSVCLFIALVRSNIITHIPIKDFTDVQCAIGYFGNYSLLIISKAFMYNLFNYRIENIFQNTPYAFHRVFHIFLYVVPWYNVLFVVICLYIAQFIDTNDELEWNLNTDNSTYILFCGGTTKFTVAAKVSIVHSSIIEFIMSVTLLYMFIKGLYTLYSTLLNQHINEYINMDRCDDVELNHVNRLKSLNIHSSSSRCEKQSMMRVLSLKNIIKKQTILVCIALISSIVYWILSLFYPSMTLQSCWDIMVNSSCIWLMFASAKPVWGFLSRYCCCRVCYRDIYHTK